MHYFKIMVAVLCASLLSGCFEERDTLKIGGKDFGESQVLSEMMAALAEDAGIPVTRRIGLGDTRLNLESLKRGDIDLYAEYNGTGLVMLGQPALADGDAAQSRVRELYEPLGISWGQRFGFANNYGLMMRRDVAEALEVTSISDLIDKAGGMSFGLDTNFEGRPLDGYAPMTSRYGLSFGTVEVVAPENRPDLYDKLLDGSLDVIEGFTTDGQIADYNLLVLEDDLAFFPVYEAAPLVRSDALVRFPALRGVLESLSGTLDEAKMRELNRRVDLDNQEPRTVARAALGDIGLLPEAEGLGGGEPLMVGVSSFGASDRETGTALRAARGAFPGRTIDVLRHSDPLELVADGRSRIALVGAEEFFGVGNPSLRGLFETLGVVGQNVLHILSLDGALDDLRGAESIATGPLESGSGRVAASLVRGLNLEAELRPQAGGSAAELAEAIAASGADAAVVMAPLGSEAIELLLAGGARLISLQGWEEGVNLVRYPYLRQSRIAGGTYPGQTDAIETLASQLVLAGPGRGERDAVGDAGPGASFTTAVLPLGADVVEALNEALPTRIGIDPALPQAASLAPRLPDPPAAVNPAPAVSLITVLILIMLTWMLWLYVRPERR